MAKLQRLEAFMEFPALWHFAEGIAGCVKVNLDRVRVFNADTQFFCQSPHALRPRERHFPTEVWVHLGRLIPVQMMSPASRGRRRFSKMQVRSEMLLELTMSEVPMAQQIEKYFNPPDGEIVYAVYAVIDYPDNDGLCEIKIYRAPSGNDLHPTIDQALAALAAK